MHFGSTVTQDMVPELVQYVMERFWSSGFWETNNGMTDLQKKVSQSWHQGGTMIRI